MGVGSCIILNVRWDKSPPTGRKKTINMNKYIIKTEFTFSELRALYNCCLDRARAVRTMMDEEGIDLSATEDYYVRLANKIAFADNILVSDKVPEAIK